MGRRTIEITIGPEGKRDAGKTFVLTEMSAEIGERWANRAILAIANAGARDDVSPGSGWAGMAVAGFRALFGINDAVALELTEELMQCVRIRTSAAVVRDLIPDKNADDIEEIGTRWHLKSEVFLLHAGFSRAEFLSMWTSAAKLADSATTSTSQDQSERSSPQA